MKENNKDRVYYLELNKNTGNSTFNNEVQSLEFVQKIGNKEFLTDYKKRDSFLMKLGKQLFRKFKNKKPENKHKLSIKIKREVRVLSQKEIDYLLTSVDIETYKKRIVFYKIKSKIRQFFYNCSEWTIIISKNNIVYKFSLRGFEKKDYTKKYNKKYDEIRRSRINLDKNEVLLQEEINQLLTEIKESED